jgi:bifunctional DNA-binding transcriptional regulator/antitoxin component of YhaV-PrlF toxin-antitoxin module
MLAKVTSKNQITIPKRIMDQMPDVRYFDLELRDGMVLLRPLRLHETSLEQIRAKVDNLGLRPDTVKKAVEWARSRQCR